MRRKSLADVDRSPSQEFRRRLAAATGTLQRCDLQRPLAARHKNPPIADLANPHDGAWRLPGVIDAGTRVAMPSAQVREIMASIMASFTCWPLPVRSRERSAAVIAWAAVMAVVLSVMTVRIILGLPDSLSR